MQKESIQDFKAKLGRKVRKALMTTAGICLIVAIAWPVTAIMAVIATPFIILVAVGVTAWVLTKQFDSNSSQGGN